MYNTITIDNVQHTYTILNTFTLYICTTDLLIIMRSYFEKPRTTVGWKGLINDPEMDGSFQINKGLKIGRKLLMDINAMGMPVAVEFLVSITTKPYLFNI